METLRFLMATTFYPPHHLGGDAVHVRYLSEALAAQGHEVHVEYSPAAYAVKRPASDAPAAERDASVQVHPLTRTSQRSSPIAAYLLGESHAVSRAHEKLVRDLKPDVIHLHNISLLGLGVHRGGEGVPVLYTAHDYWFRCPRSDLLKRGQTPCETPTCFSCMIASRRVPPPWRATDVAPRMDRVRCVIAPSQFMQRLAAASFSCPVVPIPNFVPDENPAGSVEPAGAYYLYLGVLERHKGIAQLVEAISRYSGEKRFVLVGRGSLEKPLRDLAGQGASRLEVRSGVDRSALAVLLKHAAAFLMPSIWYENAPLAAIEALSWGTPLLGTSRGGMPELVHGGAAGVTFEPTVDGILEAITSFENRGNPDALRHGAREAYETHHRPGPYLERYLSVIRSLASGEALAAADGQEGAGPGGRDRGPEEVLLQNGRHDP